MEKARVNYTEEETQLCIDTYTADPSRRSVDILAEKLNRSTKSIIGKLSREGVYRREGYKTKTGEVPTTKTEIVSNISDYLDLELADLEGLEKAPKRALKVIEAAVRR